jgi:predicted  nucleic acid-binding Zn-ribbon protein
VNGIVESVQGYMRRSQNEINILLAARDTLESELATNSVQRDLLNGDLGSVSSQLEAVKCAYNSIESECVDLRRKVDIEITKNSEKQRGGPSQEELVAAQRRLAAANDLLQQLQDDLAHATNRNLELEKLPKELSNLSTRIIALESERGQLKSSVVGLMNEVESYKKLTESLKEKLKASSNTDKDFLDTFEEVMRDEMATMKTAFEAKLRAARDESDQLSRKHSQEIIQLQQGNGSPGSKYSTRLPSVGLKMAASNVLGMRDT